MYSHNLNLLRRKKEDRLSLESKKEKKRKKRNYLIPDENELYFFSTHWITNIQYSNHVLYFNFEDYKLWLRFSKHILSNSTTKYFKKKKNYETERPQP